MLAKDIISDVIPAIEMSDTGTAALKWMEIFRVSQLPVVNGNEFLGLISDTDIYDLKDREGPVGNNETSLFRPFVNRYSHIYEVIEVASRLKLTVVPVLDEENNYSGVIGQTDLLSHFTRLAAVSEPGGIIILDMAQNDYSITQISQIIESNNAKVLSLYVMNNKENNRMDVTIKLSSPDLTSIIKTFERYNYNIKASMMDDQNLGSFYKNRYEQFIRYLDV